MYKHIQPIDAGNLAQTGKNWQGHSAVFEHQPNRRYVPSLEFAPMVRMRLQLRPIQMVLSAK